MGLTNSGKQVALTALLTDGPRWISLHTGDPGASGTANELPTGGGYGYARQSVTFSISGTPPTATNANLLRYDNLPACTVTHIAVWDAASGGTCKWHGPLLAAKTLEAGMSAEIQAGEIDAELT